MLSFIPCLHVNCICFTGQFCVNVGYIVLPFCCTWSGRKYLEINGTSRCISCHPITVHIAIDRRSLLAVVGPNYIWWAVQYGRFLPRDAMLSAVCHCRVSVCLSVCVFVTFGYCIKTAKRRIKSNQSNQIYFSVAGINNNTQYKSIHLRV